MSSRVLVVAAASMVASTVTAGTPVVPLLTVVHDDCEHSPPERIRLRPGQTAELRVVLYDIIGGVAVPRAVQTLECDQPAQVVSAQPGFLEKTSGRKTT